MQYALESRGETMMRDKYVHIFSLIYYMGIQQRENQSGIDLSLKV